MKMYTTCQDCGGLLLLAPHPDTGHTADTHPFCASHPTYLAQLDTAYITAILEDDIVVANNLAVTLNNAWEAPEKPHSAVHAYVDWGWPVFPVRANDKTPATPNGFHDAVTDRATVTDWWPDTLPGWITQTGNTPRYRYPYNIGLATGHHFDVVDVDHRTNPGALTAWYDIADRFEVDAIVDTPRGTHFYVLPTGGGNRARIHGIPGLDYRGQGGYVVAPPSQRPDGRYRWRVVPSPRIKAGWDQERHDQAAWREARRQMGGDCA